MTHRQYPHEWHVHTRVDPLEAACKLARSGVFGKFMVYEREGTWTFAGGAAGEVLLDRNGFQVRWSDQEHRLPYPENPSQALRQILADAPVSDWRVYGWAAFEFAYAQAGMTELIGDGPLLHLVMPQVEINLTDKGIFIRGTDPKLMQLFADVVIETERQQLPEPVSLDVEASGGEEYRRAVAAVVSDIKAKRLSKAIVSRRFAVDFDVDLVSTYLVGRRANTPSRSFLFRIGDLMAAGFSPETVAEVSEDGHVVSRPLAGTRARFPDDPELSARLRTELLADPKEVHEHAISVQLAVTEMKEVCDPASVQVAEFMDVLDRGSVQHLASAVAGQLAEGRTAWDAFAALFPAVTASGIPKRAAYEVISENEPGPRGLYSGSVFTADHLGALDAALVLRTIYQKGGRTWLQAGAGVVTDSTPEREFDETSEKLRSVSQYLVPRSSEVRATGVSSLLEHTSPR